MLLRPDYKKHHREMQQLRSVPRYTRCTTRLLGPTLLLTDVATFLPTYKEIFEHEIYKFRADSEFPKILDCGANIGLSVIYFKSLYPQSRIVAFEPDPKLGEVLAANLESFKIQDVEVINKAVWSVNTTLEFFSEGSDSGRLSESIEGASRLSVETIRLAEFLHETVDFLKMDIEGAETEVLSDVNDMLCNVKNIFIEYHSFSSKPQTLTHLLGILDQAGFRLHIQNPYPFNHKPLYDRTSVGGMDLLLTIFGHRDTKISI